MADVIKLTDKYIDTSSIYDTNQNKTQKDINTTINSNLSSINAYGFKIGNDYKPPTIYRIDTSDKTHIYIKATSSNYAPAHLGGLLVMEQNGWPLLAILSPAGWHIVLNYRSWTCSYSEPQWTITGNAWSCGYFLPLSNHTYSITYD